MAYLIPLEFAYTMIAPELIAYATETAIPFLKSTAVEGVKLAAGSAVIGSLFALTGEAIHAIVTDIKNPKPPSSNLPITIDEKSDPILIPSSKKKNNFSKDNTLNDLIKNLNRSINKDQSVVKN